VACSFSAGEGLATTTFPNDLGGEDERESANGGASEAAKELERRVDLNVGGESGEKRSTLMALGP